MWKIVKSLVLIFFFLLALSYLVDVPRVLGSLSNVSLKSLFYVVLMYLVFYTFSALSVVWVLGSFGFRLAFLDCLGVNQFSSLFNYIAPLRAGQFAVRSMLMWFISRVPLTVSSVVFLLLSVLSILVSCVWLVVAGLSVEKFKLFPMLTPWFVGVVFGMVVIFCFSIVVFRWVGWASSRAQALKEALIQVPIKVSLRCTLLFLFQVALSGLITATFMAGAGSSIALMDAILLSAIGNLTLVISITPGNLGAKELTYVGAAAILGVPEAPLLAVLVVDRLLQIVLSVAISGAFFMFNPSLLSKFRGAS